MSVLTAVAGTAVIAVALSLAMVRAWTMWRRTRNGGWIDVTWTHAVGICGGLAAIAPLPGTPSSLRDGVVAAAALSWALRLGGHLDGRTRARPNDPRYAALVAGWGAQAEARMFRFCQLQALFALPLVASIALAAHNRAGPIGLQDIVALAVLAVGIAGASAADRQLERYVVGRRGGICDTGLWRHSRHPNYFFEWLGWCAWPIFAIEVTGAAPLGWLALTAPAVMYVLLVYVSGIPPLEAHMLRTRGEAWRAYAARTRAFWPLPIR